MAPYETGAVVPKFPPKPPLDAIPVEELAPPDDVNPPVDDDDGWPD